MFDISPLLTHPISINSTRLPLQYTIRKENEKLEDDSLIKLSVAYSEGKGILVVSDEENKILIYKIRRDGYEYCSSLLLLLFPHNIAISPLGNLILYTAHDNKNDKYYVKILKEELKIAKINNKRVMNREWKEGGEIKSPPSLNKTNRSCN